VLSAGDLLAARYRLVHPVPAVPAAPERPAVLWLARDEVLARPVAVKLLAAAGPTAAALTGPFLDAAGAAGSLDAPVLARVYDAAVEQRTTPSGEVVDVAYVISEWVDGTPLATVLAEDGPLEPADAVALTTTVAEALTAAHARGLVHGRVHPGNLLVTGPGTARLTDLGVSAALPDGRVAAERDDDPPPEGADVRDLAAVLYALLTARWPQSATPQPSGGVPAGPTAREGTDQRGRLISPRQVRAGVPRALDAVVVRALDPVAARTPPPLTTAAGLSDALELAVTGEGAARAGSRRTTARPGRAGGAAAALRRRLPVLAVLLLLVGVGVGAYGAGREIGTVVTPPGAQVGQPTPQASAAGAPAVPIDLAGVPVRDVDPQGDGAERPGSVANATDGDPATAWTTERYATEAFGGLKEGVGLLVDLGAPTAVSRVEVALTAPGARVELRGATTASEDPDAYRLRATGEADGDVLALEPPDGTTDRYYLVWITRLAPDGDRFAAGVRELAFTGSAPR
jgi:hypothetical protein